MIHQTHRWGYSQIVYQTPEMCLARAVGVAGGASSLHTHRDKSNLFRPVWGQVEIWGRDNTLIILDPIRRPVFVAPPGMIHRMVFRTDAILIELYTPTLGQVVRIDDIDRLDKGRYPERIDPRELSPMVRDDKKLLAWIDSVPSLVVYVR